MNYPKLKYKLLSFFAISFMCVGYSLQVFSQTPTVTVRFANPDYNIATNQYCVDVEMRADIPGVQLFGMNVRFFYDDQALEFTDFNSFQEGYAPVSPYPAQVISSPAGPALFNFEGNGDWVNGAIQLVDPNATPVYMDNVAWTKFFQVCFNVDESNAENFCPALVWDMEQDPSNGGFILGDDGVVITAIDPDPFMESQPTFVNVFQFNWVYISDGSIPWGEPQPSACISLNPPIVLSMPENLNLEFSESTDPSNTGSATATSTCNGTIEINYDDLISSGECIHEYTINRTWTATSECNVVASDLQTILVHDTESPVLSETPADLKIICDPLPEIPVVTAMDGSLPVEVFYTETITPLNNSGEFTVVREWMSTDVCGNSTIATQNIYWKPNAITSCEIIVPENVPCNSAYLFISSLITGNTRDLIYSWEVSGGKSYIQKGEGTPEIYIYMGNEEVNITLTLTDPNGCTTVTSVIVTCNEVKKRSHTINTSVWNGLAELNQWPNPANEMINISFTSENELPFEINLVDITGRSYLNEMHQAVKGFNTNSIDVSQLPEGTYILQLNTDHSVNAKKIVVIHTQ